MGVKRMKIKFLVFLTSLMAFSAMAIEYDTLTNLLANAAMAQSNAYIEVRTTIVDFGTNAIPSLAQAAVDQDLSWQQRLTARICYEHIERGDKIEELRRYNWREHPDFDLDWERSMAGPGLKMSNLVISRMLQLGLWYYYIETTWKQTEEWPLVRIRRIYEHWNPWCRAALKGQPEEPYIWLAIEDRLDRDAAMKAYDAKTLYAYVRNNKQTNSVPVLVRRYDAYFQRYTGGIDAYPGRNAELYSGILKRIISFSDSSHADMLEKFIDERPDLAELKPKLEEVRLRPPQPSKPEPPFRLGTTPVKTP
jgi:hypothetical protein